MGAGSQTQAATENLLLLCINHGALQPGAGFGISRAVPMQLAWHIWRESHLQLHWDQPAKQEADISVLGELLLARLGLRLAGGTHWPANSCQVDRGRLD